MTPLALRVAVFAIGGAVATGTLLSAVRTFVLPRAARNWVPQLVFRTMRALFDLRVRLARGYLARDRAMALYAPASLLALEGTWLALEALAFATMFWALRPRPGAAALGEGISSLTTLGFSRPETTREAVLAFFAAAIGLVLVALLISYLPTMYTVFSRRETLVATLDARAGVPPSGVELLARCARFERRETFAAGLSEIWRQWELWFADVEETHTSLAAIAYFRSPQPSRSWVVAAGAVLDAAALTVSSLDVRNDGRAGLCLRAGFRALVRVAEYFTLFAPSSSGPEVAVSVTRAEFDEAWERLDRAGVPLVEDREDAWRGFVSWRRRYDASLLALADLTMAPPAPWSSDRAGGRRHWEPSEPVTELYRAADD